MSEDERSQLMSFARSRSLPSALSSRAQDHSGSADGEANSAIAARLQLNPGTVRKWRTHSSSAASPGSTSEAPARQAAHD